ncbi:PrsW family intramembrane metalloprotease [Marmoricola sp. Leaf446]|uniref:PrsW family intramembrane metalloprotease n=1 Tax=Marmoricola sp. Leaf446 TaxID=1736379 RepID=UPI0009E6C795|nr:PrsW family intramembrane metalloprotease [Marmoricola sp. Leaf446]
MQRRRSSAAFTVVVSVVMLVGALVMGLVLFLSGTPGALAVGLVLAALPVAPLIGVYMWLDRYEPEPRSLLLLALGWGAFVATSVALVLQLADSAVLGTGEGWSSAVVAPVTEEATKGLFILLLLFYRRHELDGVLDGLVYAGMVGIGFAFTENILYLTSAYAGEDGMPGGFGGAAGLFVVRGIFSPFAHPFFTSFIGIGVGLAVTSRSWAVRVLAPLAGYVLAVLAHGAWNGSLVLDGGANAFATYLFLMVPAFLLLSGFAIWSRRRERGVLTRALDDCARRGFLDPAEVPWLARISARRFARRHAERAGGQQGRRVMVAYQTEAVELGFLHHRYLRGVAPSDFAVRGQSHVEAMRALRPGLLWPQASTSTPGQMPVVHQQPQQAQPFQSQQTQQSRQRGPW